MRTNLKVPFPEKDDAKKLGARWDAARKLWYVQDVDDLAPFAKWSPTPHDAANAEPPKKSTPVKAQQAAGLVVVGTNYSEQARICECLPWEVCDQCQATALNHSTP